MGGEEGRGRPWLQGGGVQVASAQMGFRCGDARVPPSPAASEQDLCSHPVPHTLPREGLLALPSVSASYRSSGESAWAITAENH